MAKFKRRDIFIDLTSLLDVILILLFSVMMINTNRAGKLTGPEQEELQKALAAAQNQNAANEYLKELVEEYNVGLENSSETGQTILIFGDKTETITIPKKKKGTYEKQRRQEWNVSVNNLKMDLDEKVQETLSNPDKLMYIIFTYSEDSVYERDFFDVHRILDSYEVEDTTHRIRYRINR